MLSLPWFISRNPEGSVVCYSPFAGEGQRSHHCLHITRSRRRLKHGYKNYLSFSLPNGWLLLGDKPSLSTRGLSFTLLHPLSQFQIQLPYTANDLASDCKVAASPPPKCVLSLIAYGKRYTYYIYLFRLGDRDFTVLEFPEKIWWFPLAEISTIVWREKVYYMSLGFGLMVIDPYTSDPALEFLDMDQSQLPVKGSILSHRMELFMVEFNGKILLVVKFFECDLYISAREVVDFQVFEPDFSKRRWVRVESLGDRVLLIYQDFICSLSASDIGAQGNCIYYVDKSKIPTPWRKFDMGTGKVTESSLPYPPPPKNYRMFVPSIC